MRAAMAMRAAAPPTRGSVAPFAISGAAELDDSMAMLVTAAAALVASTAELVVHEVITVVAVESTVVTSSPDASADAEGVADAEVADAEASAVEASEEASDVAASEEEASDVEDAADVLEAVLEADDEALETDAPTRLAAALTESLAASRLSPQRSSRQLSRSLDPTMHEMSLKESQLLLCDTEAAQARTHAGGAAITTDAAVVRIKRVDFIFFSWCVCVYFSGLGFLLFGGQGRGRHAA